MGNGIIRGTTPTLKFNYSIDVNTIRVAYLTIRQSGVNIIEKSIEDAEIGDTYISWKLTQADTLLIPKNSQNLEVQCRFKLVDGTAGASDVYLVNSVKILKDGEI